MENKVFGHIEGLLEAWTERGDNMRWKKAELTDEQKARLTELFNLLSPAWIVRAMTSGYDSEVQVLLYLTAL